MRHRSTWRTLMTVHGMHREASIEITASPEAVYDLVSNLPRMGEWSPENIGGEWQGGGSGKVGDRFIGHNRTSERAWSVPVLVTVAERGRCFTFVTRQSEEHTSELQSHSELVCRLLLEKKTAPD